MTAADWQAIAEWLGSSSVLIGVVLWVWQKYSQRRVISRRVAIQRIAQHLAAQLTEGYEYQYARYEEHFLGGRHWRDEWGSLDQSSCVDNRPSRRSRLVKRASPLD